MQQNAVCKTRPVREHRLDKEIWKTIPGHPEYAASTLGGIKCLATGQLVTPTNWDPSIIRVGKERRAIAYWILITFRGPSLLPYGNKVNCHLARHLDDNRSNNQLGNLAWGTQKENIADARRNGRIKYDDARRRKHGDRWRGKHRPIKTNKRISKTLMGHSVSLETRTKIANTLKLKYQTDHAYKKMVQKHIARALKIRWGHL